MGATGAAPPRDPNHPVWEFYDQLRQAALNVRYYSIRLDAIKRWNFVMDIAVATTAPGSAIAGFLFWTTPIGEVVWKSLISVAAIIGFVKPFLRFPERISRYEETVTGYRGHLYDLELIKSSIKTTSSYGTDLKERFSDAMAKMGGVAKSTPEVNKNKALESSCRKEVLEAYPTDSMYVP